MVAQASRREPQGQFEQVIAATLRSEEASSGGLLKYHTSPMKGDRRYHFLTGTAGALEIATIPVTDDAEWTFVNRDWVDQSSSWNQFQAHERNEGFIRSKVRELRVRLGLPWEAPQGE